LSRSFQVSQAEQTNSRSDAYFDSAKLLLQMWQSSSDYGD
jgi:hypothetical protein